MVLDGLLHQYLRVSKDDSDIYLSNLRKSIKFAIINHILLQKISPLELIFCFAGWYSRGESNPNRKNRNLPFYPLNYGSILICK